MSTLTCSKGTISSAKVMQQLLSEHCVRTVDRQNGLFLLAPFVRFFFSAYSAAGFGTDHISGEAV